MPSPAQSGLRRAAAQAAHQLARLPPLPALVAVALDLAPDVLGQLVDAVGHVRRRLASPQGHALQMERRLGDHRLRDRRVALLDQLDLQGGEVGDLLPDPPEPPEHVLSQLVRYVDVAAANLDAHGPSCVADEGTDPTPRNHRRQAVRRQTSRAKVTPRTSPVPARRSALAHAARVAPVVITSSTSTATGGGGATTPIEGGLVSRSFRPRPTCRPPPRRDRQNSGGRPTIRPSARASSAAGSKPRRRRRSGEAGTGTREASSRGRGATAAIRIAIASAAGSRRRYLSATTTARATASFRAADTIAERPGGGEPSSGPPRRSSASQAAQRAPRALPRRQARQAGGTRSDASRTGRGSQSPANAGVGNVTAALRAGAENAAGGDGPVGEGDAGQDDDVAQAGTRTDPRSLADHDGPGHRDSLPELDAGPEQDRGLDLGAIQVGPLTGADARRDLRYPRVHPDRPREGVDVAGVELLEVPDVVPVLVDLMRVERHVALEQRREHVHRPVGEAGRVVGAGGFAGTAGGEEVEDLGLEHVDAAVGEVGERFVGVRLLLEALDPPV